MKRRGGERGAALLWAVTVLTLVSLAVATVAARLGRQAAGLRLMREAAAREDLEGAARAWERAGAAVGDRLELAGGTIELAAAADGEREWILRVRGCTAEERIPTR